MKRPQLSALIFGDDSKPIRKVKSLLAPYCKRIELISAASIGQLSAQKAPCHVIVVIGPIVGIRPSDFFIQLPGQYPNARLIYISDTIDANSEINVRAAWTLFVGSLDAFNANVAPIFQSMRKKQLANYLLRQRTERMALVRETATAVGHEVDQPLQTLQGWTESLLMDVTALDEKMATRLTLIRDEVQRLSAILSNLKSVQSFQPASCPGKSRTIDSTKSADRSSGVLRSG